ncbi:MAG: D-alanyl-D-alanine carboxypeptidase family protein [Candidatus Levybacteria bacterium]|nr:D-alanyl-D-alanine carboxypeptidase family protein [Candidatus Levybacteria bacterium]
MKDFRKFKSVLHIEKKQLYFFTFATFLVVVLYIVGLFNQTVKNQISNMRLSSNKIPVFSANPYPLVSSILGSKSDISYNSGSFKNISAEAALIMDDDSKVILFSKNENLRFSMASTTKIMTALTALDYYKLDDVLTVKTRNVEGSIIGLKIGEKLLFRDLLYAMLLPSGNDAAMSIAQNYPGGEEEFIKKMNEKAISFSLYNTKFSDPTGLSDDGDYTTIKDLARLSSIAMENEIFQEVVSTKEKTVTNISGKNTYSLYNLNRLLGTDGVDGIKTGYTDIAGGVLTTSRSENGHKLIIVVMSSKDRFLDTQRLLSLTGGKINYINIRANF